MKHHKRSRAARRSPNRLLASLPAADHRRLFAILEPVSLPFQHVLLKPGQPLEKIYFPGNGVFSITQIMKNGRTLEVATVGNEGFIGINALFDGERWLAGALVKAPDDHAQVMSVSAFQREMNRGGPFSNIINRYAQGFVAFLMQSVACNAVHSVEQRCARWLLTTRDRVGRNDFPMTQELLAVMLGVRRPSVTIAVNALQRAGLIEYGHKRLLILDRPGLEATSCECYAVVKKFFARLLA
jgi:CRP-like cAMP-binding protein